MQRLRETIEALKAEIEQTVDDRRLTRDKKIERIFQLRMPEKVEDGLNVWLNRGDWVELKRDREFWLDVIHRLGFVDVEATNEMGNKMFSLPEIAAILGDDMAYRMMQQGNLFDLPSMEQQTYAKKQFMDYMLWYDESASMNYLVLYGRYMALKMQLVPIEVTREHQPGGGKSNKLIETMNSRSATPESAYNVVSNLTVVAGDSVYPLFFYQQKEEGNAMPRPFVIQQGTNKKEIAVSGVIMRVLKFFYPKQTSFATTRIDTVFIVLWGPDDNKLLRFSHLNVQDVMVVDKFVMNPEDFDDLTYASDLQPTRFATNTKSARGLDTLITVDLTKFSGMLPQTIRRLADLTREEKRKLAEQRQQNLPRETQGYLNVQTEYDYGRLFMRFAEPVSVRFSQDLAKYTTGQVELLAVKLIRVPIERNELFCHLATLVRHYTSNEGDYDLQLRLYRYQATVGGQFTSFASRIFRLENFLTPDTDLAHFAIAQLNVIFHSETIFYIQVMERRVFFNEDEFRFVSSQLLEFDFQYKASLELIPGDVSLATIKDASLFEEARKQNYRLYDYRHDTMSIIASSRYDAIFYRYNAVKAYARLIFYKSGVVPTVAEYRVDQLKPQHLIGFVPLPKQPSLAFMSYKMEELRETVEGEFRILTLDTPLIVKFSLPDTPMTPYTPETLSLASKLHHTHLSAPLVCTMCGETTHMKDSKTGKLYCDTFCQKLYRLSYRLA
jgi:hypothetical protein